MQRRAESNWVKLAAALLVVVFGLIVVHTPFIVLVGSHWPAAAIPIKGWKEVLIGVAGLLLVVEVSRRHMWRELMQSAILRLVGGFVLLHLVLLQFSTPGVHAVIAGLLIDLRYVLYFALVYICVKLAPQYRTLFMKAGVAGAAVVVAFALLQVFVLPRDALSVLGYSTATIEPYLTIDENPDYVRINSTLRGPNPLGAYMVMVLAIGVAYCARLKNTQQMVSQALLAALLVGGGIALWASYSRSALMGGLVAIAIAAVFGLLRRIKIRYWVIAGGVVLLTGLGVAMFQNTSFVSNVFFHEKIDGDTSSGSNAGHLASLQEGTQKLLTQPLGAGIGSTGSPSYYSTTQPMLYIENYYLYVAHEVGWLGLLLFIAILLVVLKQLWRARKDWLALGLFASGVGLSCVALLLPVWADDTVSLVWWGAAGVVLAGAPSIRQASLVRRFIDWNKRLSARFDQLFVPSAWRKDGLAEYITTTLPPLVKKAKTIYDIGGGKRPYVGTNVARSQATHTIVGVDIDEHELKQAPKGAYDKTIVADIGSPTLKAIRPQATLVICQVLLEHVYDNDQAIKNMHQLTAKDGIVTIFVPSKNALFAIINRFMPEFIKRKLLYSIFPETSHAQGFPAYYNECTPKKMRALMEREGFTIESVSYYFQGTYFTFFVPLHVFWRLWQAVAYLLVRQNAADYFCIIARK